MINALHLLWIIPLTASIGFITCAILTVGKRGENDNREE